MGDGRSWGGAYGWKLSDWSLIRLFIVCESFRHLLGQPLDSGFVPGMSGKELVGLLPAGLLHPLPDSNRFVGIIAGVSGQEQSDIVCLRFVSPAEGQ